MSLFEYFDWIVWVGLCIYYLLVISERLRIDAGMPWIGQTVQARWAAVEESRAGSEGEDRTREGLGWCHMV